MCVIYTHLYTCTYIYIKMYMHKTSFELVTSKENWRAEEQVSDPFLNLKPREYTI